MAFSDIGNLGNIIGNKFGMTGSQLGGGLGGILNYFFTDPSKPYEAAQDQYQGYLNQGAGVQQPFYNAGQNALGSLNQWLGTMKDPSQFINNLMNQYQASPYSQYLQQQAQRAGTNAASASGLIGSTPFQLQSQENAANIASGDMNQWLQNVLGINTQYGAGQQYISGLGADSANKLTALFGQGAKDMSQLAYDKEQANQQHTGGLIGSVLGLFGL